MSSPLELFEVGDRVVYIGFPTPEYGTITGVTIVVPKSTRDEVEVRLYIIEMDDGGIFSGLSRHLRRAK
jgi:hypothetical protein